MVDYYTLESKKVLELKAAVSLFRRTVFPSNQDWDEEAQTPPHPLNDESIRVIHLKVIPLYP